MSQPTADAPRKDWFTRLATDYARSTGDSTFNVIQSFLSKHAEELLPTAVIHDNACGVGTATSAILAQTYGVTSPRIAATDNNEPMIEQVFAIAKDNEAWNNVNPSLADSHDLPFPDETFSLSITNISITNFLDPPKCLGEICRTVKPDGLAVVSIWKRFTPAELIHQAQKAIKGPDAKLMTVPKAEYFQDGYLRGKMVEAGFSDVRQSVETTVITGEALEGLREFTYGPFTASAKEGWTDEEKAKWEGAIDGVIAEELQMNSGILMEVWFVTGRK